MLEGRGGIRPSAQGVSRSSVTRRSRDRNAGDALLAVEPEVPVHLLNHLRGWLACFACSYQTD